MPKFIYRSSVTGKIVTADYAKKNPATTFKDKLLPSLKDAEAAMQRAIEFMKTGTIILTRALDKLKNK